MFIGQKNPIQTSIHSAKMQSQEVHVFLHNQDFLIHESHNKDPLIVESDNQGILIVGFKNKGFLIV